MVSSPAMACVIFTFVTFVTFPWQLRTWGCRSVLLLPERDNSRSGHEITHKRYIWVEETRAFLFVTRIGENYLPKATPWQKATHLRVAPKKRVGCRPQVLKLSSNFGENKANLNHTYLSIHLYTLFDMLQVLINEERCKQTKECTVNPLL